MFNYIIMAGKTRANKKAQKRTRGRTQRRGRSGGGVTQFLGKALTNASRFNVNTIGAMTAKLNALLIHNKVPYKFSDGTLASQYDLSEVNFASDGNAGRGNVRPVRNINMGRTGFSSFNPFQAKPEYVEPSWS